MNDASRLLMADRLLSALPEMKSALLRPNLERAELTPGTIPAEAGDSIRYCFFPNRGMISLLSVTESGEETFYQMLVQAETDRLIGRERRRRGA
jgi:hypothetical protein